MVNRVRVSRIFTSLKQRIRQLNTRQILGLILFVGGVYLLVSTIYTIRQMCGGDDEDSWLWGAGSVFSPFVGLASLASGDEAEFDVGVLVPLIGGMICTIAGAVLFIVSSIKRT